MEVQKICNCGIVSVIPIETGALGTVSKHEDMGRQDRYNWGDYFTLERFLVGNCQDLEKDPTHLTLWDIA